MTNITPVLTAFIAYINDRGEWWLIRDIRDVTLELDRPATADEMYAGCAILGNPTPVPKVTEVDAKAVAAFLVSYSREGSWAGINDPRVVSVEPDRPATVEDVWSGCAVILKDLAGQAAAQYTQVLMMQTARAMQEQQANAQLLTQMGQASGLHVPGRR